MPEKAETVTLNQLIAASSDSVLRALKDFERDKRIFNPRIWVGIWIDPYGPIRDLGDITGPGPGGGLSARK
jgi:hypothetical protein